jgi:hypothetical protein
MFLSSYAKQKGHNYYTILCSTVFCEHVHFDGPHDTVEPKLHEFDHFYGIFLSRSLNSMENYSY